MSREHAFMGQHVHSQHQTCGMFPNRPGAEGFVGFKLRQVRWMHCRVGGRKSTQDDEAVQARRPLGSGSQPTTLAGTGPAKARRRLSHAPFYHPPTTTGDSDGDNKRLHVTACLPPRPPPPRCAASPSPPPCCWPGPAARLLAATTRP